MSVIKKIAENFSNGKFETTYNNLAENIEWHIFGERIFTGKRSVIENCEQTANYFKTVDTNFETYSIIEEGHTVAINGKAEFSREGKLLSIINSCDVYEFDNAGNILRMYSYCITKNKQ